MIQFVMTFCPVKPFTQIRSDYVVVEYLWNEDQENRAKYWNRNFMSLCTPQIPHGLPWNWE